ncbi:hypothetical protein HanRHA438_Chr09g0374681 [Helianthus annuus]|nr:hypothetical protein HanRHA438_Chr09g0374681 [Helianthus annuus]
MCFILFDYLLVYSMGKQRISDIYRQLDSSPKDKGTSFQPNSSGYLADIEEGIFIRKAQSKKPFTTKKRNWIISKSREKIKKLQPKGAIINQEINAQTQETGNNLLGEDELDEQWVNLHMLATTAVNANLY